MLCVIISLLHNQVGASHISSQREQTRKYHQLDDANFTAPQQQTEPDGKHRKKLVELAGLWRRHKVKFDDASFSLTEQ